MQLTDAPELTFVMIKPDAYRRKLVGEIISRFERKGLEIVRMQLRYLTWEEIKTLYFEHEGREYYERLTNFIKDGPVVLMVLRGLNAVGVARIVMGKTLYTEALPGSIRGDFALHQTYNLVHGSDCRENADRELKIFFPELLEI